MTFWRDAIFYFINHYQSKNLAYFYRKSTFDCRLSYTMRSETHQVESSNSRFNHMRGGGNLPSVPKEELGLQTGKR